MASSSNGVSRRGLVSAGAALAAGGAAALTAEVAQAAGPSATDAPPRSQASPITSTIASPRRDFLVYRTVGEFDFSVENATAHRRFGGQGVYSADASSALWASIDLPGGVILDDVEFYVSNTTGSDVFAGVWLWSATDGYLAAQLASVRIVSSTSVAVTATRALFTASNNGPFPTGTKLFLRIFSNPNDKLQINGARVGMRGGGNVTLRPTPVRAYDSRPIGKLAAGETRTIQLGSSYVRDGTVGALTAITVLSASSAGYVAVYPETEAGVPETGRLYHQASAAAVFHPTVATPVSRRLKIYSQREAHVLVDVIGTVG